MSTAAAPPPTVTSLEGLLFPVTRKEFLDKYWGKEFTLIPGSKGKFANLAPWSQVNRVLEEHRLRPPRLQLYQNGKEIDPKHYLHSPEGTEPILKAADLTNLLARGASLLINEFDELSRPIRDMAVSLERIFRIHVRANVHGSWRTDYAFPSHYDPHDTFILQVFGKKHWTVHRPTRPHPLDQGKDVDPAPEPTDQPIWEGYLEGGSLLYIPRGWWYVVHAVDEPTLHVTVALRNLRGIDLLHWFLEQLRNCVEVRQDLPHLAGPEEQAAYVERLRQQVFASLTPDILNRYLAACDSRALPRPNVRLPESGAAEGLKIDRRTRVEVSGPGPLDLSGEPEHGIFKFKCCGKNWQCTAAILPALRLLDDGQKHSVKELIDVTGSSASAFAVESFLQALALKGVITLESDATEEERFDRREECI